MDLARRLADLEIPEAMPFALDDDGRPMAEFNLYFRMLPRLGVRSINTWKAYSLDVFRFARFLSTSGKPLLDATIDDIEAYRKVRLLGGDNPVGEQTWTREVVALEGFYRWAVTKGLIAEQPFVYRQTGQRCRNTAKSRRRLDRDVRSLSFDQFVFFRNVGLRGLLPDGSSDTRFIGQHRLRNTLFADLLVTTGLRLEEASTLLACEIPVGDAHERSAVIRLGDFTAKGNKPRDVRLPARLVRSLAFYLRSERSFVVARANEQQSITAWAGAAWRCQWAEPRISVTGSFRGPAGSVKVARLLPAERLRLVVDHKGSLEPIALFVGQAGRPLQPEAWERVFQRASERCASFEAAPGVPPMPRSVTPHLLRHSYAVHTLRELVRDQIRQETGRQAGGDTPGITALRHIAGNPVRILQKLLGHSQVSTTYIYLDSLDDTNAAVDAAVASWSEDLDYDDIAVGHPT